MPGIDETKQFVPLKIAVLTVSDTRDLADDKSGATLAERITKAGHLISRLKPLLKEISEKDMNGSEPADIVPGLEKLEAAFAEFRAEYVELYEAAGSRLGAEFPEK